MQARLRPPILSLAEYGADVNYCLKSARGVTDCLGVPTKYCVSSRPVQLTAKDDM